ncbi:hypothetical protein VTK73DRAFT_10376 [Phialemonium thermophilum]|uniref:Aminoglycoside phosphotransferase domain-containing protein n=1 Tax=Phialemonium thermophilum TaxID=223376 RepID=A0ABR3VX60_9PEZI
MDAIVEARNQEEHRNFVSNLVDAKHEIEAFVAGRLGWPRAGRYGGFRKGSFNVGFVIENVDSGCKALIRFPVPGRTYMPWRAEKVTNEAMVLDYLREHTTIPVPRVLSWGLEEESPRRLGPFLILEYVHGTCLDDLLKQPTKDQHEPSILDPSIDEAKLDGVYDQIASYIVQLSRLEFPRIGAIGEGGVVLKRPLTYDMNDLVTTTGYPADRLLSEPVESVESYFHSVSKMLWTNLETQRNAVSSERDARRRFTARRCFPQLIPKYSIANDGPFVLFVDDFRPANMLADPETLKMTAVLDFEFTNAMPAQFAWDVPGWLLLQAPAAWLERDERDKFLELFVPRMEQFLRAVERAETESPAVEGQRLSARMRESWDTGRFWFNSAIRSSLDIDTIYWSVFHDREVGIDKGCLEGIDEFADAKMKQLDAYVEEEKKKMDCQDESGKID